MPRFKLLTQGSVLQHESGFTIGYAISNKDFELMENSLISAVGILNNHPPTAPVLSALAMIKGFSEGMDAFRTWKNQQLATVATRPIPSNIFLDLPDNECTITLGAEIDDNKPSQMIYFELLDVIDFAKSLRIAYELVNDLDELDQVEHVSALLEIFEGAVTRFESKQVC